MFKMNRIPDIDREIAMMDERFTVKLHRLLADAQEQGFTDVIQWDPGGRSFTVYQTELFAETIMKKYFKQTKYKSFQRQLNLYDFKRVTRDGIRGVYYHPLFLRHDPLLCQKIKRKTQPLTDLQAANRLRNDVALLTLELAPTHPFDDNTALRTTEAYDDLVKGKEKGDDESIETIDGYVEDINAGELFKVGKRIER